MFAFFYLLRSPVDKFGSGVATSASVTTLDDAAGDVAATEEAETLSQTDSSSQINLNDADYNEWLA